MRLTAFIILLISLSSCEVKVNTDKKDDSTKTISTKDKFRNGIKFDATGGLKVEQAFLTYADGPLVDEKNITSVGRPLVLNLVVDGWKSETDSLRIGASEKVTASEGSIVLNEEDLFNENKPVAKKDARFLTLQVVLNKLSMLVDYFQVDFKFWNKGEDQSITGEYKFYIKEL